MISQMTAELSIQCRRKGWAREANINADAIEIYITLSIEDCGYVTRHQFEIESPGCYGRLEY